MTARKRSWCVLSLSFKHLAVRGFLFCFHSCAPKREQRATFFTSSRVCRDIFFSFQILLLHAWRLGHDAPQWNNCSRSFVCPWIKAQGKRSYQSNVQDIQRRWEKTRGKLVLSETAFSNLSVSGDTLNFTPLLLFVLLLNFKPKCLKKERGTVTCKALN